MDATTSGGRTAGFFAGIGGLELGFEQAGFETGMLCEFMPEAQLVLKHRFPKADLYGDIRDLVADSTFRIPHDTDVVTAGFPCQDLSPAGRMQGIKGKKSSIVKALFHLLERRKRNRPNWLVIENVPFMLQLDRGKAMDFVTSQIEALGYTWAYRIVDTRSFGLPHRRRRVIIVASLDNDPCRVLFADNEQPVLRQRGPSTWCGFYWTEGNRGLGWTIDAVPTLKAGSTIGIPSPPAMYRPRDGAFLTPAIEHAEALQGFEPNWTTVVDGLHGFRPSMRWKLVGNAVSVPVSRWVARRIKQPADPVVDLHAKPIPSGSKWPKAGCGQDGQRYEVDCTEFPASVPYTPLSKLIRNSPAKPQPLSVRASSGILTRLKRSSLRTDSDLLPSLQQWVEQYQSDKLSGVTG